MRRDVGGELLVAIASLGLLAFALTFGIILSLSSSEQPAVIEGLPSQVTATQAREDAASPTAASVAQLPTATVTETGVTESPQPQPTVTTTLSPTPRPTRIAQNSAAATPTHTATAPQTATRLPDPTTTPTLIPSNTPSFTPAPTETSLPTETASPTATASPTVTPSITASPTATLTLTASVTASPPPTASATVTPSAAAAITAAATAAPTLTPAGSASTVVAYAEDAAQDRGILPTPTPFAPRLGQSCTLPPGWAVYDVQSGNTLFAIASAVGSTVGQLRDANCLQNVDNIITGDQLFVPRLPLEPVRTLAPLLSNPAARSFQPVGCTDPGTHISAPLAGAQIDGVFTVFGTAQVENLDYYKLEIRPDFAAAYNFYDRYPNPVSDDALGQVNTSLFDDGVYWLRLTVVDNTGNFPPPCDIPLIFGSGSR